MSELLTDLLHAVAGAGLTLGLEHGGRRALAKLAARSIRSVWSFLEKDTHVFVPLLRPLNQGAAIGYGDLLALSAINELRSQHFPGAGPLQLHTALSDYESVANGNVIVLGGGRHNSVYRSLVAELQVPLHFFDTETESFVEIRNENRSVVFSPTYDTSHAVSEDVGFVVLAGNARNQASTVLLAAGSHSFGTAAAIRYIVSLEGVRALRSARGSRRELVVRCAVRNGSITSITRLTNLIVW